MIFNEDVFYNLKPEDARSSTTYVHRFYNTLTEPFAILGLLAWACGYVATKLYPIVTKKFNEGTHNAVLYLILSSITLVAGVKIIHSLYWAKKDYSRIEFDLTDIGVFGAVLTFTSGYALIWLDEQPIAILIIYASLCLVAVLNFINLRNARIPSDSRHYDVDIEKKIQTFNAVAFSILGIDFFATASQLLLTDHIAEVWPCSLLLPMLIFISLNIIHSHQLSAWPKLLINNSHLSPDKIEERVDAVFGLEKTLFKEKKAIKIALREYKNVFKKVTLRRATRHDIDYVTRVYIENFEYVLSGILLDGKVKNEDLMSRMLSSAWGLGAMGIFRFYIIEVDECACGFVVPEFRAHPKLYTWVGQISLAWFLVRRVGLKDFYKIYGIARNLRTLQPRPLMKELRINYIAIEKNKQRQGNGSRALFLIKQAFLDSSTNDFRARTFSAVIREKNEASIKLFKGAGFNIQQNDALVTLNDPLEYSAGKLIRVTLGVR